MTRVTGTRNFPGMHSPSGRNHAVPGRSAIPGRVRHPPVQQAQPGASAENRGTRHRADGAAGAPGAATAHAPPGAQRRYRARKRADTGPNYRRPSRPTSPTSHLSASLDHRPRDTQEDRRHLDLGSVCGEVWVMRKNDGRRLDHRTLEVLWLRAVEHVASGTPAAEVGAGLAALGLHRRTIYTCWPRSAPWAGRRCGPARCPAGCASYPMRSWASWPYDTGGVPLVRASPRRAAGEVGRLREY